MKNIRTHHATIHVSLLLYGSPPPPLPLLLYDLIAPAPPPLYSQFDQHIEHVEFIVPLPRRFVVEGTVIILTLCDTLFFGAIRTHCTTSYHNLTVHATSSVCLLNLLLICDVSLFLSAKPPTPRPFLAACSHTTSHHASGKHTSRPTHNRKCHSWTLSSSGWTPTWPMRATRKTRRDLRSRSRPARMLCCPCTCR